MKYNTSETEEAADVFIIKHFLLGGRGLLKNKRRRRSPGKDLKKKEILFKIIRQRQNSRPTVWGTGVTRRVHFTN